ncbi:MAG: DNA-binding protein [Candidatus Thermoplasmatota archaeon]|jgi:programmed cell death protein 5|nr:DNA-binding protein [Candidatus Thermoplasmatota archaeon]
MDEDLENLRKKRLQELQQQIAMQGALEEQEAQREELEQQKKIIMRAILTPQARERLGRIKVARPDVAEAIENQLIILAQEGRLRNKIDDDQLVMLLSKIMPKKKDITIKRR